MTSAAGYIGYIRYISYMGNVLVDLAGPSWTSVDLGWNSRTVPRMP
jgi:hypothetical protein